MIYSNIDSNFKWFSGGSATARMTLNATAVYVGGITVSSSDKRLQFNEKPVVNALDINDRLMLVEYDPTHDLTE